MGRPPTGCPCLLDFVLPTTSGLTARSYDGKVAEAKSTVKVKCSADILLAHRALPDAIHPLYRRRPAAPPAAPERYCLCATPVVLRQSLTVAPRNLNAYMRREALRELEAIATYGLAPGGALVIAVFLWKLCLAPFRMLEAKIKTLNTPSFPPKSENSLLVLEKAKPEQWMGMRECYFWRSVFLGVGLASTSPAAPLSSPELVAMASQLQGAINSGELSE